MTGITFSLPSWRRSGWSCCTSWCPAPRVSPCSSIRPISEYRAADARREAAARAIGLQIHVLNASTAARSMPRSHAWRERPDALFVAVDPFFVNRRDPARPLAARHALPATIRCANLPRPAG